VERKASDAILPDEKSKTKEKSPKSSDESKKKADEAALKKRLSEASDKAAQTKKEEDALAQKKSDESASGACSRESIKAREQGWKKLPEAEKKEKALELLTAAKAGQPQVAVKLMEGGVSANCSDGDGWTPLMKAAEVGKVDMMKLFFDYGAESGMTVKLGEWGNNALHHAARHSQTEAVKLLLARGSKADCTAKNFQGKTPRDYATDSEIKSLIKKASK